jgi:N-acetyl-anhydromuramyl-L-alanine amidase AmpD
LRMRKRILPVTVRMILCWLAGTLVLSCVLTRPVQGRLARPSLAPPAGRAGEVNQAFDQASAQFHVPEALLKAICYIEGRLSNNEGAPSMDDGFGCMHLIKNTQSDLLDRAAGALGVSAARLKLDMPENIRAGALLLHDYALRLSRTHRLPTTLGAWYGAVAAYSNATTRSTALMYAEAVYALLSQGFRAPADDDETVTLTPQAVQPDLATAASVQGSGRLPAGCKADGQVDFPGAIDCVLPAATFDCNLTPTTACNFTGSDRPTTCTIEYSARKNVVTRPCKIDQIVIHDIEGTALSALNTFQNPQSRASAQYVIESNGTIYQVVREKDIAYHAGNFWYNQHTIGIEHTGFDANGFRWYNATEYLASARLTAYLLQKYNLPLDRAHLASHAMVPAPSAGQFNHVDPGPYWLWDYYFTLIHQQGIAFPDAASVPNIFLLHPHSDRRPLGKHGRETRANFSFFYLYTGPSTATRRVARQGRSSDPSDITDNVEPGVSYYCLAKVADPAGSGATMYKIWYGVQERTHARSDLLTHAHTLWLAVPRGAASSGQGSALILRSSDGKKAPQIYSQPVSDPQDVIGDAPAGAIFVSVATVSEDGAETLWYQINYNHRQGWVPASEVAPT